MKRDRMFLSNDEKLAMEYAKDATSFVTGDSIEKTIEKERASKFNNQVENFIDSYNKHSKEVMDNIENLNERANTIEIKPVFSRILIQPFKHNPFQRIEIKNGIITDTGGFNPAINKNPNTGELEELEEMILCATVIEAGPECKYVKEGDAIFYRKDCVLPVPFLKQNLWTINENQVLAIVNEHLTKRFNYGR